MPGFVDPQPSHASPVEAQSGLQHNRLRLHITPFSPELLSKIIPDTLEGHATSISFHSLQTFPERGFGYVELPVMAAEKLKKKLNGATLMGEKIKVQDAKPEKRRRPDAQEDTNEEGDDAAKSERREKKKRRKLTEKVHDGYEIPENRRIKRGWTETSAEKTHERMKEKKEKKGPESKKEKKKRRESSKYTNEPELLFRTKLEPTAATTLVMEENTKEPKKEKKRREKELDRSATADRNVIIHEFEHTTKHAGFLRQSNIPADSNPVTEYVDGKGWIDDAGRVIEAESKSKRPSKSRSKSKHHVEDDDAPQVQQAVEAKQASSKMADVDQEILSPSIEETERTQAMNKSKKQNKRDAETGPASTRKPIQAHATQTNDVETEDVEEAAQAVAASDDLTSLTGHKDIHPLEALYKRPKLTTSSALNSPNRPPPIDTSRTSFSFFDTSPEDDDQIPSAEDDSGGDKVDHPREPTTPFTERDMHWRGMRSAAPPPDTPGGRSKRIFTFDSVPNEEDEDEEGDVDQVGPAVWPSHDTKDQASDTGLHEDTKEQTKQTTNGEREQSEIAKWFYENRGENNRAWRRRRREVLKTKRQTENRKFARRLA